MRPDFPELSKPHEATIRAIADVIVAQARDQVTHVILFGSFARGTWVYAKRREDGLMYEYASDYDILILTRTNRQGTGDAALRLRQSIEKKLGPYSRPQNLHSPQLIIEPVSYVNKRLEQSHYFFSDIRREGIMLYDSGETPLANPRDLTTAERQAVAQEHFDIWFPKGRIFLEDAQNRFKIKDNNVATFYLHQAAENLLTCTLLVLTDYKPRTHDLRELYGLSRGLSNRILEVFNFSDEWRNACFEKLRHSYIDARYKIDFTIDADQLTYLIDRVTVLHDTVKAVCEERIVVLGKG